MESEFGACFVAAAWGLAASLFRSTPDVGKPARSAFQARSLARRSLMTRLSSWAQ
jgi:hypothetical protein